MLARPSRQVWSSVPAVGSRRAVEQEARGTLGRGEVARLAQQRRRARERPDHQPVPVGEHLVVDERPLARVARREQRPASRLDPPQQLGLGEPAGPGLLGVGSRNVDDVAVGLEGRLALEAVHHAEEPSLFPLEHGVELGRGPGVVGALVAVRLGVDRRQEAALVARQLAQHEVERLARHALEARARARAARPRRRAARAPRCRRASSRSAARARLRRSSSGGSRRRAGP